MRISCKLCKFCYNGICGRKQHMKILGARCELFQYFHVLNPHDLSIIDELLDNIEMSDSVKYKESILSETIKNDDYTLKYHFGDNVIYITNKNKHYKVAIDLNDRDNKDIFIKYMNVKKKVIGNFYNVK